MIVSKGTAVVVVMTLAMATTACSSIGQRAGEPAATAQPSPWNSGKGDFAEKMVRCLSPKGWDVRVGDDDQGLEYQVSADQRDRFHADLEDCRHEFGFDVPLPPVSQQYAERTYIVFLQAAECVRGLGYEVSDPPSKQAFVEEMMRKQISSWHPYDDVVESDPGRLGQLESQCPIDLPY